MPEVLIESIPFVIGAALGWLTFDFDLGPWRRRGLVLLGCGAMGIVYAWLVGELGGDLITALAAACIDGASFAIGWIAARLAMGWRRAAT